MSLEEERLRVWKAIEFNSARIENIQVDMRETVTRAVKEAMPRALLTDEEHRWVVTAIERQNQSIKFRQKIIESSALWAVPLLIMALLAMFREYAIAHGMWRP